MSHSTNSNVNLCDICDLSFGSRKDFLKHTLTNQHQKRARDIIMDLDEAETKTKPKAEDNIYTRIKSQSPFHGYECKECHEEFRNKIALTTHSYIHNRKYLENTEDFDINSSQNMKEFYITDKGGNYIKDIDEATNYSLEDIKNCYQFRRVKSFKYKITVECDYEKRTKEDVKIAKIFFNTDYINNNAIYENGDSRIGYTSRRKHMKVMVMISSFLE